MDVLWLEAQLLIPVGFVVWTVSMMHVYSDFNRWQPGRDWFQEYRQDRMPRYWYSD